MKEDYVTHKEIRLSLLYLGISLISGYIFYSLIIVLGNISVTEHIPAVLMLLSFVFFIVALLALIKSFIIITWGE
jgi:hypothetical protein